MNITNYLLFNCSSSSIQNWKISFVNNQRALIYSLSASGNITLSYQLLSEDCSTTKQLRNKNTILFPQITFVTSNSLLATWIERERSIDNAIGHGVYLDLVGNAISSPFQLSDQDANFAVPSSVQLSENHLATLWIEQSASSSLIKANNARQTTFNSSQNILISNNTAGSILFSTLSASTNNILIAWQKQINSTNNDWDVYAQFYDFNLANLSQPTRINDYTNDIQGRPAVASTNNTFLISWNSGGQIDNADIFFKILDNNGNIILPETLANTYTLGSQNIPQVAGVNGIYGIVWTSNGQDGDQGGIYTQLLYSNGTKIGNELRLNSETVGSQRLPQVWVEDDNLAFGWLSPYLGRDVLYGARIDTRQFLNTTLTNSQIQTWSVSGTHTPSQTLTESISETKPTAILTHSATLTLTPTTSATQSTTATFTPTTSTSRTVSTSCTQESSDTLTSEYSNTSTPTDTFSRTFTTASIIQNPKQDSPQESISNTKTKDYSLTNIETSPTASSTKTSLTNIETSPTASTTKGADTHVILVQNHTQQDPVIPKSVVKSIDTISQVTSVVSFSLPNAILSQRVSMSYNVAACKSSNEDFVSQPLDWPDSPLQFTIGDTSLKYIDGALAGTWLLRIGAFILHLGASKKFSPEKVHFPGGQILVTMFFYSSTALLETTMFRFGTPGEKVSATFSLLSQLSLPIVAGYKLLNPSQFKAFATPAPDNPWLYDKIRSLFVFLPEHYFLTQWSSKPIGYIKRLGDLFEGYKKGYQWFVALEMFTSLAQGVTTGFASKGTTNYCSETLIAMTTIQAAYTTMVIFTLPAATVGANVLLVSVSTLQLSYLAASLAQHYIPSLKDNNAVQTFIEVTPTVIQVSLAIISVIDIVSFCYKITVPTTTHANSQLLDHGVPLQDFDMPLLQIVATTATHDIITPDEVELFVSTQVSGRGTPIEVIL
ncbi:MAG: hypothetical protein KBC27_02260 [Rickettsiales bacterium]|nr:hypothetical protein [Rickettsiales bacterium]